MVCYILSILLMMKHLIRRSVKALIFNSIPFLIFFLFFVISLLFSEGFAADPVTGTITMEKFKYLHNFIQMPVVLILFLGRSSLVFYMVLVLQFSGKVLQGSGLPEPVQYLQFSHCFLLQALTEHHFIRLCLICRAH